MLVAVPFLDRSPERSWRKRPVAIALLVVTVIVFAGLTVATAFTSPASVAPWVRAMRRVRVTFWTLVAVAVLATGALSRALTWSDGPAAALTVGVCGLVAVVTVLLAARILVVLVGRRS